MNEQFRKLLEQSFVIDDYVNAGIDGIEMGIRFDPEKFAELIVKETMQVVANNLPQNTYLDVADAVIEHFKE